MRLVKKNKARPNRYSAPNLLDIGKELDVKHERLKAKISSSSVGASPKCRAKRETCSADESRNTTPETVVEANTVSSDNPDDRKTLQLQTPTTQTKLRKDKSEHMADRTSTGSKIIPTSDIKCPSSSNKAADENEGSTLHSSTSMPNISPVHQNIESPAIVTSEPRIRRKFMKHFKKIAINEEVLNSYSCALLSDILLQGTLYITSHHFAFHSKIFGYETRILVPVSEVIKIRKQKIVKIIPNAIGVYTESKRYIFGSLISRNATYRLMCHVLRSSVLEESSLLDDDDETLLIHEEIDEDSCTGSGDGENNMAQSTESASIGSEDFDGINISTPPATMRRTSRASEQLMKRRRSEAQQLGMDKNKDGVYAVFQRMIEFWGFIFNEKISPHSFFMISGILLVFLTFSSAFLLYRLHHIQTLISMNDPWNTSQNCDAKNLYRMQEIHYQEAMNKLQSSIQIHILQLNQVRNALQTLVNGMSRMDSQSKQYENMARKHHKSSVVKERNNHRL